MQVPFIHVFFHVVEPLGNLATVPFNPGFATPTIVGGRCRQSSGWWRSLSTDHEGQEKQKQTVFASPWFCVHFGHYPGAASLLMPRFCSGIQTTWCWQIRFATKTFGNSAEGCKSQIAIQRCTGLKCSTWGSQPEVHNDRHFWFRPPSSMDVLECHQQPS